MAHYHDSTDFPHVAAAQKLAPTELAGWQAFHDSVLTREDGAVPLRYRELIAVAISLVTKCPYCIDIHTAAAKRLGVTQQELTEAVFVAGTVGAGGPLAHGLLALKLYGEPAPAEPGGATSTEAADDEAGKPTTGE